LLVCVLSIPGLLNQIPYAALAAVLLSVGYKLTKPALFFKEYEKGWAHIVPFVITIVAILLTDLLWGIGIGLLVGGIFVIYSNYKSAILYISDGDHHLIRFKKDMSFMHKKELREILASIPDNVDLLLDVSRTSMIDLDNVEIINDFIETAKYRDIRVRVRRLEGQATTIVNGYDERYGGDQAN
jgi:MFS superfamily sulfate permease-like transporter